MNIKTKKLFFLFVILSVTILISACNTVVDISIPKDERPQDEDEFDSEAELIAKMDRLSIEEAKESLRRVYPEFGEVKKGLFMPPPRRIEYISCEDSDGGKAYSSYGVTTGVISYGGSKKKLTFRDSCNHRTAIEYYCRDNRFSREVHECQYGCWDGRYCK